MAKKPTLEQIKNAEKAHVLELQKKKEHENAQVRKYSWILGVICFLLVAGSYCIGSYNTFVTGGEDIENQWSNVKTEYQRRADLTFNMVEVASTYAKFEKDTFIGVSAARSGNFGTTKAEEMKVMSGLDSSLARLLVIVEQYPQLKSNEQFNRLTDEMQRTENRVQIARSDYNSIVRSYNLAVSRFPRNILARTFGFEKETYFENEDGTDTAPKVNMEI